MILMKVLVVLGTLTATSIVFLLSSTIALAIARVRIENIVIFYGPTLTTFKLGELPIKVGVLPTGCSASFDTEDFRMRSLLTRLGTRIVGPVAILISSVICLSFSTTLHEFFNGFGQILKGALSPLEYGNLLIEQYYMMSENAPLMVGYGVLSAKIAAYNLLPIPGISGGQVIMEMIPWFHRSTHGTSLLLVGMLIHLAIVLSWIVAFVSYFIRTY